MKNRRLSRVGIWTAELRWKDLRRRVRVSQCLLRLIGLRTRGLLLILWHSQCKIAKAVS